MKLAWLIFCICALAFSLAAPSPDWGIAAWGCLTGAAFELWVSDDHDL